MIRCGGQQWAACVPAPIQLTCPWVWAVKDGSPTGSPLLHFSNGEVRFADDTHVENMRVRTVKK